jgi:hypothetical protein
MTTAPFFAIWDGENLVPLRRHAKFLDASLVIGERYKVDLIEERSAKSHKHFFAQLREIWLSLPDDVAEQFPNDDALRKFALIKTGFCDRADVVCANNQEAMKYAAVLARLDPYTVVSIQGRTVSSWTAKTQKVKAMGAKDFNSSKHAVLEYCASLIGVRTNELKPEDA